MAANEQARTVHDELFPGHVSTTALDPKLRLIVQLGAALTIDNGWVSPALQATACRRPA